MELGVYAQNQQVRFKSHLALIGADVKWARIYYSTQSSGSMPLVASLTTAGYKVHVSFKPNGRTWEQVAAGDEDARWTGIGNMLAAISPAGKWTFNHEPENDRASFGSDANGDAFTAAFNQVASIIKPLAPSWQAVPVLFDETFPQWKVEFGNRGGNWQAIPDPNRWWPASGDEFGFDYYAYRGASDSGSHWATQSGFPDSHAAITEVLGYCASWGVKMCFPEFGAVIKDPAATAGDEANRTAWLQTIADDWGGYADVTSCMYFEVNDVDVAAKANYSITDPTHPPENAATLAAFAAFDATTTIARPATVAAVATTPAVTVLAAAGNIGASPARVSAVTAVARPQVIGINDVPSARLLTTISSATDAATYSSATADPVSDTLLVAFVGAERTGDINPATPTIINTPWRVTWYRDSRGDNIWTSTGTGTPRRAGWIFVARLGTSPGPDTFDVSFGGVTHMGCEAIVLQILGTTDDGPPLAALIQTVVAKGTGTTPAATLAAPDTVNNRALAFYENNNNLFTITPDTAGGWTEVTQVNHTGPTISAAANFHATSFDTTPTATMSSALWGAWAIEIGAGGTVAEPATVATTGAVGDIWSANASATTLSPNAVAVGTTVVAVATAPAPTVKVGALATPAKVTATAAVVAVTIRASALLVPTEVAAVAAVPADTTKAAALVAPATVAAIAATGATTHAGASIATPSTVAAVAAITGSPLITAAPLPSTVVAAATAPSVILSGAASPSTVAAVAAVPAAIVTISGQAVATPIAVIATAAVVAPILSNASSPAVTAAVGAVPGPTITSVVQVRPSTVTATVAIEATPLSDSGGTPATVAGIAAVPAPAGIVGTVIATPATAAARAGVPAGGFVTDTVATAATVAARAAVGTGSIELRLWQVSTGPPVVAWTFGAPTTSWATLKPTAG